MRDVTAAETLCLLLDKRRGESALRLLRELQLLDTSFRIGRDGNRLIVPLMRSPSERERSALEVELSDLQVSTGTLTRVTRKPRTITEALKGLLTPNQLASLPRSIDIVGEIAIIELPEELREFESPIGRAILETNRNLRTVLAKAGPVSTEKRIRHFDMIAGADSTETTHREYGCLFRVDVAKVYFSPRLSFEHERVARQVRENETVVDMFAGVGPFAIHIAKRRRNVRVYAIDMNEDAIRCLRDNVLLNNVDDKVVVLRGDARTVIQKNLAAKSDRVVMNHPSRAAEYVEAASMAIKPEGGVIHYYTFGADPNPLEKAKEHLSEMLQRVQRRLDNVLYSRIVRGTAPHEWLCVLDALVR